MAAVRLSLLASVTESAQEVDALFEGLGQELDGMFLRHKKAAKKHN